jgi:hypothetical protein
VIKINQYKEDVKSITIPASGNEEFYFMSKNFIAKISKATIVDAGENV